MAVALKEVALEAAPVGRVHAAAGPVAWEGLCGAQARAGELLAGRTVWSINSTATGGGVAEILRTMLPYTRAVGLDARWLIMRGSVEFFRVTKRIHNFLHEHPGDGGPVGGNERSAYEGVIDDAGCDQLVVHVCRWDRLKDPVGVIRGFADHTLPRVQAHLILAGPSVHAVSDDPEEPEVLDEVEAAWRRTTAPDRGTRRCRSRNHRRQQASPRRP